MDGLRPKGMALLLLLALACVLAAALASAAPPAAGGEAAAPPAPVALRIGLNTPSAEVAPFWIAKEEGVFARPEIATVQDLRGRPVAITGRAGIIRRATDLALRRNGLDPERDVTLVATGNVPNSLSALLAGAVDAAMLSLPATFRAEDEGLRLLVDTAESRYPTILQGVAARRSWLAQHEELAQRVLQALSEGIAFAHQQKERTKEIIGQYTQNADPRDARAHLPCPGARLGARPLRAA
jgi:ABC-type nitrate/sulfonate/bicarbonate transport system substrate-binding protein